MKHIFNPRTRQLLLFLACAILLSLGIMAALPIADTPPPGWILNPDNGHYYNLFIAEWISWPDAYKQASEMNLNDCQGYLATVTSEAESNFLVDNFGEEIGTSGLGFWLGGYQELGVEPADYGWQWVTGEPWDYTNWESDEPNDFHGPASEQYLDIFGSATPGVLFWNDEGLLSNIRGYIVECALSWVDIQIDVKPGSWPNSINLAAKGVVPVAVLLTYDFNASSVDPSTVLFAGAEPIRWSVDDVNKDGVADLIFHYKTQSLDLDRYSTEASLVGQTFDGQRIQGMDSVRIVP